MTMFKMFDAPLDHHSYIRMLESEAACMRPSESSSHAGCRSLLAPTPTAYMRTERAIRTLRPTFANQDAWAFVTPKRPKTKSIHTAARPKWPRTQSRYVAQMFFPRTFSNLINPSFGHRVNAFWRQPFSQIPNYPPTKFALFGDGWWKCHTCVFDSRNLNIQWRVFKALHGFTLSTHAIWISTADILFVEWGKQ